MKNVEHMLDKCSLFVYLHMVSLVPKHNLCFLNKNIIFFNCAFQLILIKLQLKK